MFLFSVGSFVGFLSGLLGIGGGIIMFPLLLYMPPLLGFESINVKSITGLTMMQGFLHRFQQCFITMKTGLLINRLC